jgi:hypothetical protein
MPSAVICRHLPPSTAIKNHHLPPSAAIKNHHLPPSAAVDATTMRARSPALAAMAPSGHLTTQRY